MSLTLEQLHLEVRVPLNTWVTSVSSSTRRVGFTLSLGNEMTPRTTDGNQAQKVALSGDKTTWDFFAESIGKEIRGHSQGKVNAVGLVMFGSRANVPR